MFGIILFTEKYKECVEFYRDKLGLPMWFDKENLCCLHFGGGYMMIETEGISVNRRKSRAENPTIIRFNVPDVAAAAALLIEQGIEVKIYHHDWGTVGTFLDPDGNVCGLKNADDAAFDS